jgi:sugar lactone lactonase YvrE
MGLAMNGIKIVTRRERDVLGEGPLWSPARNSLFWVDVVGQQLHCLRFGDGTISSWSMPEPIGWIVERNNSDGFLIGLKSGFALFWPDPFRIEKIGNPEPHRPHNRLNDAKADRFGRIWAGSKDDHNKEATGALYRLDADHTWSRQDDGYCVANGPTFSMDYRILYHTDTSARVVYAFNLSGDGELSEKRVWLRFQEDWGYPDGMTTDAEGCVWIAHWGGARISRFLPNGTLDRIIRMPATNITSIAFGGNDLRRLFVTSAMLGCEQEQAAGCLFELDSGVQGIAPHTFAG